MAPRPKRGGIHAQRPVHRGRPRLGVARGSHGPHGGSHRVHHHVRPKRRRPRHRARRGNGVLPGPDARRRERRADGHSGAARSPGHAPPLPRRAGRQPGHQRDDPQHRRQPDGPRQRGHPVRHQGGPGARQAEQPAGHGHQRDGALPGHQHGRPRGAAERHDRRARFPGIGRRGRHLLPDVVRQRVGDARRCHRGDPAVPARPVPPHRTAASGSDDGWIGASRRAADRTRRCGRRRGSSGAIIRPGLARAGVLARAGDPGGARLPGTCRLGARDRRLPRFDLVLDPAGARRGARSLWLGAPRPGLRLSRRRREAGIRCRTPHHSVPGRHPSSR